MTQMAMKSYAQVGEDLQIAYLLGRNKGIHYIDVGCLWPTSIVQQALGVVGLQ